MPVTKVNRSYNAAALITYLEGEAHDNKMSQAEYYKMELRQQYDQKKKEYGDGELHPCSEPAPPTETYIKNRKAICAIEDEILQKFPDCREYLDRYKDALGAEAQYESEADFARGFRIGALIMYEILSSDAALAGVTVDNYIERLVTRS